MTYEDHCFSARMCNTQSQEIKFNVQSVGSNPAQLEDFNFISCCLRFMLLPEDCFQATDHDVILKHRNRNQRRALWIKFRERFQKREIIGVLYTPFVNCRLTGCFREAIMAGMCFSGLERLRYMRLI